MTGEKRTASEVVTYKLEIFQYGRIVTAGDDFNIFSQTTSEGLKRCCIFTFYVCRFQPQNNTILGVS